MFNILENSFEAMPDRGIIKVETQSTNVTGCIVFTATGIGMNLETEQ
jgi:signal transduction histidine kinase